MGAGSDPAGRSSSSTVYAAFFGCALIWGSTFLLISVGNDTLPPLWAASWRLALAFLVLTAITVLRGQRLPDGAARRAAVGYGVISFGINFALLYWGEKYAPSGLAAVMYATTPLSSTFYARLFGLERLTAAKLGAACIALVGVAVIFSGQLGGNVSPWPLFALLGAALTTPLGAILLKRGPRQSAIGSTAVGSLVGCVVCVAGSFAIGEPHALPRSLDQIVPILYLTLAGSVGAFVLFAWLVNRWDVSRISFVSVIVPVVAMILGSVFRHERLTVLSLIGSALVLTGVLLRIWSDRRAGASGAH